ncbi:MAG: hypothetical protein BWY70_01161 [Bacteroidetes bacterium ADurb.Bin408]|nr:MAG: hypothetical protein BWY70_01161 [Bacteroidetes bacterium ADurb.Bin408]
MYIVTIKGCFQVAVVGTQVNTYKRGTGRGKFQVNQKRPFGLIDNTAGGRKINLTVGYIRAIALQLIGCNLKRSIITCPRRILCKITIAEIITKLGYSNKRH